MSWRDPDHLPNNPPNGNSPDMPFDDTCEHCNGTGDDPDVAEARGITIMCPRCGGTGVEQ